MQQRYRVGLPATLAAVAGAAVLAGVSLADSTPIGALPAGPASTIQTQSGELVAVALPARSAGRVWRIARAFDTRVLHEVSEANVGSSVVVVFKTTKRGSTTVFFALTKGDTGAKAYESRRIAVKVR